MAATILTSPRAIEMSIYVVRAFVQLRELLNSNRELARRLPELETRLDNKLSEHHRLGVDGSLVVGLDHDAETGVAGPGTASKVRNEMTDVSAESPTHRLKMISISIHGEASKSRVRAVTRGKKTRQHTQSRSNRLARR
jgi:hypothetical protein